MNSPQTALFAGRITFERALVNVTINTPNGMQIPISAVVAIEHLLSSHQILRENTKRCIVIGANVAERN